MQDPTCQSLCKVQSTTPRYRSVAAPAPALPARLASRLGITGSQTVACQELAARSGSRQNAANIQPECNAPPRAMHTRPNLALKRTSNSRPLQRQWYFRLRGLLFPAA